MYSSIYTGIADLFEVKTALKNVVDWIDLGLALGLHYPTLQKIDDEKRGKVNSCMREMLAAWLQQQDNVSQVGAPSWSVLQTALRKIEENELADTLPTCGELKQSYSIMIVCACELQYMCICNTQD